MDKTQRRATAKPDQAASHDGDKADDFKLEYYKYILQEMHTLNENHHKYLSLFHTLATAIIGGGVAVFLGWKQLNISAAVARQAIEGLRLLLVILGMYVCLSMLAGVFSWYDYRHEEVDLLDRAIRANFRIKPHWRNFWRWHETYFILFTIVVIVVAYLYVEYQIIPLIQ